MFAPLPYKFTQSRNTHVYFAAMVQTLPWRLRIFLLNTTLHTELRYDEVAPLLSSINPHQAMEILKHLEDNAALVVDPTGWVTAAARRAYLTLLKQETEEVDLPTPYPLPPSAS